MIPQFFVAIAGVIHIYIFIMESVLWGTPKVNQAFGMSPEKAAANKLFAYNQGFYNLFLAIAAIVGIILSFTQHFIVANTLMSYACLSMLAASMVLAYSKKKLLLGVFIQGLPPAVALLLFLFIN